MFEGAKNEQIQTFMEININFIVIAAANTTTTTIINNKNDHNATENKFPYCDVHIQQWQLKFETKAANMPYTMSNDRYESSYLSLITKCVRDEWLDAIGWHRKLHFKCCHGRCMNFI